MLHKLQKTVYNRDVRPLSAHLMNSSLVTAQVVGLAEAGTAEADAGLELSVHRVYVLGLVDELLEGGAALVADVGPEACVGARDVAREAVCEAEIGGALCASEVADLVVFALDVLRQVTPLGEGARTLGALVSGGGAAPPRRVCRAARAGRGPRRRAGAARGGGRWGARVGRRLRRGGTGVAAGRGPGRGAGRGTGIMV